MDVLDRVKKAALAADQIKAEEILILRLEGITSMTDYFLIASGTSDRHAKAIAEEVIDALRKEKIKPLSVEGLESGSWVLIDYGDFVVHIFQNDTRLHYDLEHFWEHAPRVNWKKEA